MNIISYLIDNYFKIMKSVNVRSISIAIIVLIIIVEFLELFVKPEDIEPTKKKAVKNKEEKSSLLRKMVKINTKTNKKKAKTFGKDDQNNFYKMENRESNTEKYIPPNEELEVLGSKTVEINTVIEGNRIYMEKKEEIIQN